MTKPPSRKYSKHGQRRRCAKCKALFQPTVERRMLCAYCYKQGYGGIPERDSARM